VLFSILGLALWCVPPFVFGLLMVRDGTRYVDLYRAAFPEEHVPRVNDPLFQIQLWRFDETGRKRRRMLFKRQPLPELERARRQYWFWAKCMLAWVFLGIVFPFLGGVLDGYLAG
jgi:hypothetical protein